MFEEYEKLTGRTIEAAIKNEFSGSTMEALLDLVGCVRNKLEYLAERLHKSVDGLGTDDRTLIRIVVTRSEKDLGDILEMFELKYGKSLAQYIKVTYK